MSNFKHILLFFIFTNVFLYLYIYCTRKNYGLCLKCDISNLKYVYLQMRYRYATDMTCPRYISWLIKKKRMIKYNSINSL